jgi:hypothetical protein
MLCENDETALVLAGASARQGRRTTSEALLEDDDDMQLQASTLRPFQQDSPVQVLAGAGGDGAAGGWV